MIDQHISLCKDFSAAQVTATVDERGDEICQPVGCALNLDVDVRSDRRSLINQLRSAKFRLHPFAEQPVFEAISAEGFKGIRPISWQQPVTQLTVTVVSNPRHVEVAAGIRSGTRGLIRTRQAGVVTE